MTAQTSIDEILETFALAILKDFVDWNPVFDKKQAKSKQSLYTLLEEELIGEDDGWSNDTAFTRNELRAELRLKLKSIMGVE